MGGAAGINLLLGMIRVKFAAVLIGVTGVGLNASFSAVQGLVGTVAGLGIQSSAVREIAAAVGRGDEQAIGRAVLSLRRICWLTGLTGMLAMMLFSPLLSQLTFGHADYSLDIGALGLIILFNNINGGQMALIQGLRRIGDMARANVIGALFGTVVAIGLYATLGLRGIVPTLILVSAFQLLLSWRFARELPVAKVNLTVRETFAEANSMVRLGLVFMANGLMGSAVAYATVALITHYEGVQAVGIYSAAYALSGMFVGFVLSAMGADYYPRLTEVAYDKQTINRLVNEQTLIALLLGGPGLLATLALAPWIIRIFYSGDFLPAVKLLQWFVLGCFGRVISWPLGYLILALGKGRWYLLTETAFNLFHVGLIAAGIMFFGIEGVAVAFFVMYVAYTAAVYLVSTYLVGFKWSPECKKVASGFLFLLVAILILSRSVSDLPATIMGIIFTIFGLCYTLKKIRSLVGPEHRLFKILRKIPGFNFS